MRIPATVLEKIQDTANVGYHLIVMGADLFTTFPLPLAGVVTVGRSDTADIRLTDPLASRQHARISVGETLTVEDLDSANKTRVRDVALAPGIAVTVVPGEAIAIGSTILMVQHRAMVSRPRRVWPHGYFECRVEEECVRSEATRAPFAIVRLHVEGDAPPSTLADFLAPSLRLPDMLAVYGPGEFEILLASTPPELARAITENLTVKLSDAGIQSRVGVAFYPRDGRAPEALLGLACERLRGAREFAKSESRVIVEDPAMQKVIALADRAAQGTINLLIIGETGVGKEVMAERVHRRSPRSDKPFLCLNCASLSESLLESELFGHERGAFTGANETKPGLLETAPGGTVFLDEIGELPLGLQAKLLRVLESRQVTRVGGLKPRPIDVRFLAATNRHLEAEVAAGRFRRDLYFRLNGMSIQIPPLRARRSEIAPLAQGFIAEFSRQLDRRIPPILSPEALDVLEDYFWPGNVRELRNVIERAMLLTTTDEITPEHFPLETMTAALPFLAEQPTKIPPPPAVAATPENRVTPPAASAAVSGEISAEQDRILRALEECAGNQTRAARMLNIARSTLVTKLDGYGIRRPRKNT